MHSPAQERLKTILYICDNQVIADVRSRILRREGYEVITAPDVQEGRKHWRERREPYDLVLFEISGPAQPALELCEEIKADHPDQLYAVLASSRTYLSREACPDGVLNKDEGPRSVVEQVHALLARA